MSSDKSDGRDGRRYIVHWRKHPVSFCAQVCKRIYMLVSVEEATAFDSQVEAARACREYGLKLADCEIVTVE